MKLKLLLAILGCLLLFGAGLIVYIQYPLNGKLFANQINGQADPINMDCVLIVPPNPLTAQGLATPYRLKALDVNKGQCHQDNPQQDAFVQGAIIDTNTGQISIYNPLVIDDHTKPATSPIVPTLPQNSVVALWFGFNGNTLTLRNARNTNSLDSGQCVNGTKGSIFGQFAYCNAPAFFKATDQALATHLLKPPALGTALDGQICPTTRDFSIVDQDQSDNVTTSYLLTSSGQFAQDTQANVNAFGNKVINNGSDERLVTLIDKAIGCKPWIAPDLANPGHSVTALPLNEIQAAVFQAQPIALVPNADPMVLNNAQPSLAKLNLYRLGVDQPEVQNAASSGTKVYCEHLAAIAPGRLLLDKNLTIVATSPDPAVANSLFTFLTQRFVTTFGPMDQGGLNCSGRLGQQNTITIHKDINGVTTDARINR